MASLYEMRQRNKVVVPWLKEHAQGHYVADLCDMLFQEFGWTYTDSQVRGIMSYHHITNGRQGHLREEHYRLIITREMADFIIAHRYTHNNDQMFEALKEFPGGEKLTRKVVVWWRRKHKQAYRKYPPEFHEFVKANVNMNHAELARLASEKFGIPIERHHMSSFISYNKYSIRHRKAQKNPRARPIGAERLRKSHKGESAYWEIKVAEPNVWRAKSTVIWEEAHGEPLPKGYRVVYLDGDHDNLKPENLHAVPISAMGVCNSKYKTTKGDAELTRLAYNLSELDVAIHKQGKDKKCMKNHTVSETGMGVSEKS